MVPQSDLAWSRHTYLLCKIVKISNVCDGAPVRKPFGFATLPLSEIIRAQRQQAGDTFIMQIHLCGKDKEFMLMPGHICKKSKFASAANDQEVAGGTSIGAPGASTKKNSSMAEQGTADGVVSIVLQLFKGDLKTIMKDKKSDMISGRIKLVNSIGSIPLKSPFHPPPHVPVPGSASVAVASLQLAASENRGLTHELYLSLLRGDFVSEDLRKGVEISIFAMKENGEPLSTARFYPSDTSYHPADSVYRSVVIAGTLHPLWHECIRISIPQSDYKKTHLLFILRDCSEKGIVFFFLHLFIYLFSFLFYILDFKHLFYLFYIQFISFIFLFSLYILYEQTNPNQAGLLLDAAFYNCVVVTPLL